MASVCLRIAMISAAGIIFAGCVKGTVSTAFYNEPPQPASFVVVQPDPYSLTDRNISTLLEAELSRRGFTKAVPQETANIGVLFKYSIDQSGSVVSDGNTVSTYYPRHFHVSIIDLRKSKPDRPEFVWQGEVYSSGSSRNISRLAPIFIEQLFQDYGKTVMGREFMQ